MKKPTILALALLIPTLALSAPTQYGGLAAWQVFRPSVPTSEQKAKRVIIIRDRDLKDTAWGNGQTMERDLDVGVGKLAEMLRAQGAEVTQQDYYTYADSNAAVPGYIAAGMSVSGTGISGGTTVSYVSPLRDYFSLSSAATANNQAATLTIGGISGGPWKIVSGKTEVRLMLGSNEAFRTLGDYYSCAVMVGFRALFRTNATHEKKFFCPESTNVQMVHLGGTSNYAGFDEGAGQLYGSADSCRSLGSTESITGGRAVVPYKATGGLASDTLWFERVNYALRPAVLPAGVSQVVRLFHPVLNTLKGAASDSSLYWGSAAESTLSVNMTGNYRYRAGWWNTTSDSVARRAYEPLPIAWRVYWTDANADGKDHVDFVKTSSGLNSRYCYGDVAFSLISRYAKLSPIKIAMEWDDMANMNFTNGNGSAAFPTGTRPDGKSLDSLVVEMRNVWGVRLAANIAPDSLVAYINGLPENQWKRNPAKFSQPHSYYTDRKLPWIFHSHDSSSTVASNLVGKFGGYYPANGQNNTSGNYTVSAFTHRVYSASVPGLADNDPNKYGIVQRLLRSDSLRSVYCRECPLPPYLSYPNNDMMPTDWKVRSGGGFPEMVGSGALSMQDFFNAQAVGLKVSSGQRTLYTRGYFYILNSVLSKTTDAPRNRAHFIGGTQYPQFSIANRYREFDRDSLAAEMFFLDPDAEINYGGTFGLKVRNLGCLNISQQSDVLANLAKSQLTRNMLLGFANPQQRAGFTSTDYGEGFVADPNGIISGNTNVIRNGAGRVRVVYIHPLGGTVGPGGAGEVEVMRTLVLRPLRALNRIAGHPIHSWVYPWETVQ